MSGIKLTWDIGSFNPEKHYIYRSDSPISLSDLPTPIAEVGQGINQYNDLSITEGETYHYFVAAEKKGLLCPADSSVSIEAILHPGPQTLLAGDMTKGFFGEVSVTELFSGDELASLIGLTDGISQYSSEPWLKFAQNGEILYIAKKSYRRSIAWNSINDANAVYDDSFASVVSSGRFDMRVTLMTGGDADPATSAGGEWNNLIYKVHVDDPAGTPWVGYTNTDLNISTTNGGAPFMQETSANNASNRVYRGYSSLDRFGTNSVTSSFAYNGWRPVLRLQL